MRSKECVSGAPRGTRSWAPSREHAHFGLRREHRRLHGLAYGWASVVRQVGVRASGNCAKSRNGKTKSGLVVHPGQKLIDHVHADLGPAGGECRAPALYCCRRKVAHLGRTAGQPAQLRRYDLVPLQQVPDEGTADTEAQHKELVDPGDPSGRGGHRCRHHGRRSRAGRRIAAIGVAQVCEDAAILALELLDRVGGSPRANRSR